MHASHCAAQSLFQLAGRLTSGQGSLLLYYRSIRLEKASNMEAKRSLQDPSSEQIPANLEGFSLPGWIYRDPDFLEAERERIFAASWQVMCHLTTYPIPATTTHWISWVNPWLPCAARNMA